MNETPEPATDLTHDRTTMFSLLKAAEAVQGRLEAALGSVGLSMPKYSVLNELVQAGGPLPLCELANRLSCVRSNITQLVDRLETDGLVKRVDDPADRRSVRAEITPTGRERQAAGAEQVEALHRDFESAVGPSDRTALGRMLAPFL